MRDLQRFTSHPGIHAHGALPTLNDVALLERRYALNIEDLVVNEPQKRGASSVSPQAVSSTLFEPLLSAVQAAPLLGLHPNTLLSWAREGRIPSLRLGRRVAFRASALNLWLDAQYTDAAVRVA